jgi:hypothetical protein
MLCTQLKNVYLICFCGNGNSRWVHSALQMFRFRGRYEQADRLLKFGHGSRRGERFEGRADGDGLNIFANFR